MTNEIEKTLWKTFLLRNFLNTSIHHLMYRAKVMIGNQRILVNILARAGSTSVKNKNIAIVGGKPVLWYSITEAKKSKYADDICVSTDSEEYAEMARRIGVEVPFLRDAYYARKSSTAADASKWTTLEFEKYSAKQYDYIVDFMNSNPCKTVKDLDTCIELLYETKGADTVVAVNRVWDGHPDRIKRIINGELQDWPGTCEKLESLRQDLTPPAYIRSGSVYAMKRSVLIDEGNRRGRVSIPYIMDDSNVCNIDEPADLYKAQAMMNERNIAKELKLVQTNSEKPLSILSVSECLDLPEIPEKLSEIGRVTHLPKMTQAEVKESIHDYNILIMPTRIKLDQTVWKNNSHICIVATPSVGTEHLDIDFLKSKGVKVIALTGESELTKTIYSPAELAFAHLLNITRNFNSAVNSVKEGKWSTNGLMGRELNGKTLGIIGFGSVGSNMSKYSKAFGVNIIAYDPVKTISDPDIQQVSCIDYLYNKSDIISIHASYNPSTHHLITYNSFLKMKKSCIFINTSRGEIVEEKALIRALNENIIYAAGIDVIENESSTEDDCCIESKLNTYRCINNLYVTPHIGGSTIEARFKRTNHIIELIEKHLLSN